MPGRTVSKHVRVFCDGYDISGNSRAIGPLATEFDEADLTMFSDAVKGYLPNHCNLGVGTLNGAFDNTAITGLHVLASAGNGSKHIVTVAIGDRAAPAIGVPCFNVQANQLGYQATEDGGAVMATVPFGMHAVDATTLLYPKGWGYVLDPGTTSRTGANSGTGVDYPTAASTAFGGYMVYQLLAGAGSGTVTISVDDSADNSSFSALSGATSGAIAHTSIPTAGVVALARTATVRRYLRYQVSLSGMTGATFLLSFVRMTY